jgi:hypothetical protein
MKIILDNTLCLNLLEITIKLPTKKNSNYNLIKGVFL